MNAIVDRIRHLNDISDDERGRLHLKLNIPRLRRRLGLLNSAVFLALASGVCTSLLLVVSFASAFLRLQHVFGAAVLFFLAVALLGVSLFGFGQEVRIGISKPIIIDEHFRIGARRDSGRVANEPAADPAGAADPRPDLHNPTRRRPLIRREPNCHQAQGRRGGGR